MPESPRASLHCRPQGHRTRQGRNQAGPRPVCALPTVMVMRIRCHAEPGPAKRGTPSWQGLPRCPPVPQAHHVRVVRVMMSDDAKWPAPEEGWRAWERPNGLLRQYLPKEKDLCVYAIAPSLASGPYRSTSEILRWENAVELPTSLASPRTDMQSVVATPEMRVLGAYWVVPARGQSDVGGRQQPTARRL